MGLEAELFQGCADFLEEREGIILSRQLILDLDGPRPDFREQFRAGRIFF
jgi:hypothetical protein